MNLGRSGLPRVRRGVCLASGLVILIIVIWLATTAFRALRAAHALLGDLERIEQVASAPLSDLDALAAADLIHKTHADVRTLGKTARPFLWAGPRLGWLPRIGPDLRAAPALMLMAEELTRAGDRLTAVVRPALGDLAHPVALSGEMLPRFLALLSESESELREARRAIERAAAAREQLDVATLNPRIRIWLGRLDRYLPLMAMGADAAQLAPELLGARGRRTYLILVQNEDELRATGGFISAVASLSVENGAIVDLRLEDSYAVDDFSHPYPDPPEALREYMLADLWVFRDSNWSPDFPCSARDAERLYHISREVSIDGVIAVDQHAIRLLIEPLAPLDVAGADSPVTGDNVIQLARQAWSPGEGGANYQWWVERKQFMADVLLAARAKLEHGPDTTAAAALARAALNALQEKHILVYLADLEAATIVARAGWDGAVRTDPGDYLMVVDSNVGFNKVNAAVERTLTYTVDLTDPSHSTAELIIRHKNTASVALPCDQESRYDATYAQMTQRCYWNYLRVLTAQETGLVAATPHAVGWQHLISGVGSPAEVKIESPVGGRQVMATLVLVPGARSVETAFHLELDPNSVTVLEDGRLTYRLTVQKQPGTQADPIQITLRLPPGSRLIGSDPAPTLAGDAEIRYDLSLRTDLELAATFE